MAAVPYRGILLIKRSEDSPFLDADTLGTPEFAAGKYLKDSVVYTQATAKGVDVTFWQLKDTEHTATGVPGTAGGDIDAVATATVADQLDTDHWMEIPVGKIAVSYTHLTLPTILLV